MVKINDKPYTEVVGVLSLDETEITTNKHQIVRWLDRGLITDKKQLVDRNWLYFSIENGRLPNLEKSDVAAMETYIYVNEEDEHIIDGHDIYFEYNLDGIKYTKYELKFLAKEMYPEMIFESSNQVVDNLKMKGISILDISPPEPKYELVKFNSVDI